MRILIVGSEGRLGKFLSSILTASGNCIVGVDLDNLDSLDGEMHDADIAMLAIPIAESVRVVKKYLSLCPIVEMSSVKKPFEKFSNQIISIHPLFGPLSAGDADLRNIVFVTDISPADSLETVKTLFPDFNIISLTAMEHDQLAIQLQVIPYIMSILSSRLIRDTAVSTHSRKVLTALAQVSGLQSDVVLRDTIRLNPFSRKAFTGILGTLRDIGGEYLDSDSQ